MFVYQHTRIAVPNIEWFLVGKLLLFRALNSSFAYQHDERRFAKCFMQKGNFRRAGASSKSSFAKLCDNSANECDWAVESDIMWVNGM